LEEGAGREVQLVIRSEGPGRHGFQILSQHDPARPSDDDAWTLHSSGRYNLQALSTPAPVSLDTLRAACPRHLSGERFYAELWRAGYTLGSAFRWLQEIWRGEQEVVCRLSAPELPDAAGAYVFYPGLIDSAFQALAAC